MSQINKKQEFNKCGDKTQSQYYQNVKIDEDIGIEEPLTYGCGVRHLQVFLIFASLCIIYVVRAQMSITIVAMTDVKKVINNTCSTTENYKKSNITLFSSNDTEEFEDIDRKNENATDIFDEANWKYSELENSSISEVEIKKSSSFWDIHSKVFPWPKSVQEMVLSSFFLGYVIMMSPMGLVCQRWGGKLPLQISLYSSAAISIFTPWIAIWGDYNAVCFTRVATGLFQAGTYPSIHTLIAKWVPVSERGRLASNVYTGSMMGVVMAYYISSFLVASRWGWPSVFWVSGALCFIMGIVVTFLITSTPQQHPFISEKEMEFVLGGIKNSTEKKLVTPWKAIMTSRPVWATYVAHIGSSVTYLFIFTQMPTYLHHAIGLNIKSSGLLSMLPYIANGIFSVILGILADYFINKNIMTTKQVRITSNSIGAISPNLCMFALSFITNPALAVGCLVFAMATHGGCHTGWMVNYIDMSPNFSGTLMATGNTLMNIGSLLLPVLISYIITDVTNLFQWRIVLFVVGIVGLLCNLVFVMFMSADVQPWNDADYLQAEQEDPDEKDVGVKKQ